MKYPSGTEQPLPQEMASQESIAEPEPSRSEQKRAEEALRENEETMRYIIKHDPNAIAVYDMNLRYIAASNRYLQDYNVKEEDIIGRHHYEIFPEMPQRWKDVHQRCLAGAIERNDDDCFERPDGSVTYNRWECRPWYRAGGKIGGIITYTEVTTERKKAEKSLAQSYALLTNLTRQVPGVVYQYRLYPDGRSSFPYSSPGMNDIYEVTPEAVREDAAPVYGRLHPDDHDHVVKAIQESARTLQTFYCEFRVVLPRQGLCWRWSQAQPERLEDGSTLWHGIISDITKRKQMEEQLQQIFESLRKAVNTTIQVMVSAVEARDPYTAGHQIRCADLARAIAGEMGLPQETIDGIHMAGSIHDIGKLSIPAEILSKPTKLSEIEYSLIKEHSRKGYEILRDVESPWPLAEVVHQHHERIDGSGYPRHLKGDEILPAARILAVADVVESMASNRPYRPALGIKAALEEIESNRGMLYDDAVADACLRLFMEKGFQLEKA